MKYLFTSQRLGFRNWQAEDLEVMHLVNSDPQVMRHFPTILSKSETESQLNRFMRHFDQHQFNYFAVEVLSSQEVIGFIGLSHQTYEASFNPSVDIGWRLRRTAWGKGYATEGAKRCLEYAFAILGLKRVVSVCTLDNDDSEKVMKKIGMSPKGEFKHPNLVNHPDFQKCVWYEILADPQRAIKNLN